MDRPAPRVLESECLFSAIRARGPGGQNVNKVASAVRLSFSIPDSSLPEAIKQRLLALHDHRISSAGVIMIRADTRRSLEANRADALERLQALVEQVSTPVRARKATRPGRAARARRMEVKSARGQVKRLRGRVRTDD
ncbi:MAG: aminoacyl-tRNA hydrolase [Chromatiales bacterium]|nr:aminoacyl-tRNA hydrolase [Chromatiales bacterium]